MGAPATWRGPLTLPSEKNAGTAITTESLPRLIRHSSRIARSCDLVHSICFRRAANTAFHPCPKQGHNIGACAPSRTTSPLLLLIVNPIRRKASTPPALASAAPSAAGRPAGMTAGLAPVGTNGTPSTLEACVPPASSNGLRRNASPVSSGRRILIGMRSERASAQLVTPSQKRSVGDQGRVESKNLLI
jgi:hypothetical protein